MVEQMLSARPSLDLLCIGGPRPRALGSTGGFVDEAWVENFEPEIPGAARGVGVLGVRLECETDGAVAPLLGWFPTVSFLGQASEVVTIAPRPKAGASAEPVLEGNDPDNPNTLKFVVGFDAAANQDVEISYRTDASTGHAALAGWDYKPAMSPLTIPAGQGTVPVDVEIMGDTIYEHDETLALVWSMRPTDPCAADVPALANPVQPNAVIQCDSTKDYFGMPVHPVTGHHVPGYWEAQPAIGTITNDDNPPTLTVADASAGESAGTLTFEPQIVGPTGRAVTFMYQTADGTANSGSDYQGLLETLGTIPADERRGETVAAKAPIPVTIVPDNVGESDETLTLKITDVVNASPSMLEATGTIVDDEPKIVTASPDTVFEGETLNFDITVNPVPTTAGGRVTVEYTIGPSGTNRALEDTDYLIQDPHTASGILSFDPSDRDSFPTQTITVQAINDNLYEGTDETLEVSLSNPSMNASLGVSTATGTIQDLQLKPWIKVRDIEATEGNTLIFPVEIGGATANPVTVFYATDQATDVDPLYRATAGEDYTSASGASITIPAGQTRGTIEIETPPDDGRVEQPEIFYLKIPSALNADVIHPASDPKATGTITDSDQLPRFYVADSSGDLNDGYAAAAEEGHDLTFEIRLTRTPTARVSVNYTLFDIAYPPARFQAATAGDDYTSLTGTVVFDSGETTKTVTVPTRLDYRFEDTEVFRLQLSYPSPGTSLGDPSGAASAPSSTSQAPLFQP